MELEKKRTIIKRRGSIFFFARSISNWGFKKLTKVHVEFDETLSPLKKSNGVFLYAGLHKSLWETTGILSALHHNKLPIPLVGMGDNLIKGKFFISLAKRTGSLFIVKRGKTRREIVESAQMLKKYILSLAAYGRDTLLFPEGTRKSVPTTGEYGKFFPTAFDALLDYEKLKKDIISSNPGLKSNNLFIIPFNIDYSRIREAYELTGYTANLPRTLRLWDSIKMLKNIKDVYVSFGKSIKVSDYLEKSRKELSTMVREKCLDLVKILPVNIVSLAILDSFAQNSTKQKNIVDNLKNRINSLRKFKDRFRGFSFDEDPGSVLLKVAMHNNDFKNISKEKTPVYKLYSNYINHYLK